MTFWSYRLTVALAATAYTLWCAPIAEASGGLGGGYGGEFGEFDMGLCGHPGYVLSERLTTEAHEGLPSTWRRDQAATIAPSAAASSAQVQAPPRDQVPLNAGQTSRRRGQSRPSGRRSAPGRETAPDNRTASGRGKIVITEIMYNPNSNERGALTEWVEIANLGDAAVKMVNWRLDDEDKRAWGAFTCELGPGGVAVLINGKVSEEQFRTAWDRNPARPDGVRYQVIRVKWSSLANTPGPDDEKLVLLAGDERVVCAVNIDQGGAWPSCGKPDGSSIWLRDLMAESYSDGRNWRRSLAGNDLAWGNTQTSIFDGADAGSPGVVPGLTAPLPGNEDTPAAEGTIDYTSSWTAEHEPAPGRGVHARRSPVQAHSTRLPMWPGHHGSNDLLLWRYEEDEVPTAGNVGRQAFGSWPWVVDHLQ